MNALKVIITEFTEDGVLNKKWGLEITEGTTTFTRPLSFGSVLDMAEEMTADEWAALKLALKDVGRKVNVHHNV